MFEFHHASPENNLLSTRHDCPHFRFSCDRTWKLQNPMRSNWGTDQVSWCSLPSMELTYPLQRTLHDFPFFGCCHFWITVYLNLFPPLSSRWCMLYVSLGISASEILRNGTILSRTRSANEAGKRASVSAARWPHDLWRGGPWEWQPRCSTGNFWWIFFNYQM